MSTRDDAVQAILHAYLQAVDRGEKPDRQKIIEAHPDLRKDLSEFFADASKLEGMAKALRTVSLGDANGSSGANGARLGKVRYFGDYELIEEIARGGMGVVYRAKQVSLNRVVALKMILKGELASEADVRRFRQEAEAAANLDHPNIVPIYEVGDHEGQQYFSMKLIDPGELKAGLREVAGTVAKVAYAVHHAHQRGILHRDLKPSNILIDANGEPHVADFGLAKKVEGGDDATKSGAIVGTPAYMAPEQARAEKSLTTAVDVWSLGAILYEWLTGRPPFRGDDAVSTLMKVVSNDPVKPRSFDSRIDRDLETICLKCLEKDPTKRYASAAAFADDLDRWQRGELIEARPATARERFIKWARRNPVPAAVLATLFLAGIALVTLGAFYNTRLQESLTEVAKQKQAVQDVKTEADQQLSDARLLQKRIAYAGDIDLAQREYKDSWPVRADEILDRYLDSPLCGWEWHYLKRMNHQHIASFPTGFGGFSAAWSPDGSTIAVGRWGDIALFDPETGKPTAPPLRVKEQRVEGLSFSNNGLLAASEFTVGFSIWDIAKKEKVRSWPFPKDYLPRAMAMRPDGKQLATISHNKGVTTFWDVVTGKEEKSLAFRHDFFTHQYSNQCLAYSSDSQVLAVGTSRGFILLHDAAKIEQPTLLEMTTLPPAYVVSSVAFTPDNKHLLASDSEGRIHVAELHRGEKGIEVKSRKSLNVGVGASQITMHPDGQRFLTMSADRVIRLWDLNGKLLAYWRGHEHGHLLAFRPDGKRFLSMGQMSNSDVSQIVKIWETPESRGPWPTAMTKPGLCDIAVSPDGKYLALAQKDQNIHQNGAWAEQWAQVQLCDARTGEAVRVLDKRTWRGQGDTDHHWLKRVAFSPDGKSLATVDLLHDKNATDLDPNKSPYPGMVRIWNVADGTERFQLKDAGDIVAFSPDGRWIITLAVRRFGAPAEPFPLKVWHADSGKLAFSRLQANHATCLAISSDGKLLAAGGYGVELLEIGEDGLKLRTVVQQSVDCLHFSPDGKFLAGGGFARPGRLWLCNPVNGEIVQTIDDHRSHGRGAFVAQTLTRGSYQLLSRSPDWFAFSPDSKRLAYASSSTTVRVRDLEINQDVLLLDDFPTSIARVFFSADGQKLYAVDSTPNWHVWDATPLPAEMLYEPLARRTFAELRTTVGVKSEMAALANSDPKLSAPARKRVLALIEEHTEDWSRLNDMSWGSVIKPQATLAAYELGLKQARRADELNPNSMYALNTLGIALYRVGRYDEAISTLKRAVDLHLKSDGNPYEGNLAFLAMSYHRIGNRAEADRNLTELRAAMKRPEAKSLAEEHNFLAEAEQTLSSGSGIPKVQSDAK